MPLGPIETFRDIEAEWHKAEHESDKRALWRTLARGGWFRACRDAVRRDDRATLEAWLDNEDTTKQDIVQFHGAEAAQMVHTHLLCGLAGYWARELTLIAARTDMRGVVPTNASHDTGNGAALELTKVAWEAVFSQPDTSQNLQALAQDLLRNADVPSGSVTAATLADRAFFLVAQSLPALPLHSLPFGFLCDLTRELLGEPLRSAERSLSLTALLVDTVRNEGVVTTLTLELMPNGSGGVYPVPELAFVQDPSFLQAQDDARTCVEEAAPWLKSREVRWRLQRHDGKPVVHLTGPSMGAAFALGMAKLCAEE
jgi:hypothetical protein